MFAHLNHLCEVLFLIGCCRYSPALWSRTGGHGWRHTQVTLMKNTVDKVTHTHTHTVLWVSVCVVGNDRGVCVCAGVAEGRAQERAARTDGC